MKNEFRDDLVSFAAAKPFMFDMIPSAGVTENLALEHLFRFACTHVNAHWDIHSQQRQFTEDSDLFQ